MRTLFALLMLSCTALASGGHHFATHHFNPFRETNPYPRQTYHWGNGRNHYNFGF